MTLTPKPWPVNPTDTAECGPRISDDDYAHARDCVNALAGLNPVYVAEVIGALDALRDAVHNLLRSGGDLNALASIDRLRGEGVTDA